MTPGSVANAGFRRWRRPVDAGEIRRGFLHPLARGHHLLALDGMRAVLVRSDGSVYRPTPRYEAVLAIRAGLLSELRIVGRWTLYRISEKGQAVWACWNAERDQMAERIRMLESEIESMMAEPHAEVSEVLRCPGLTDYDARVAMKLASVRGIVPIEDLLIMTGCSKDPAQLVKLRIFRIRRDRPDLKIRNHRGIGYELVSGDPMRLPEAAA